MVVVSNLLVEYHVVIRRPPRVTIPRWEKSPTHLNLNDTSVVTPGLLIVPLYKA
jgi:hypothetical protein